MPKGVPKSIQVGFGLDQITLGGRRWDSSSIKESNNLVWIGCLGVVVGGWNQIKTTTRAFLIDLVGVQKI